MLFIQEEEAEAIRLIYDKFANISMGYGKVAQYLNLQGIKKVQRNKARLENEIDTLPEDTRFRDRKLHDMTIRLDGLYDIIVELEEKLKMQN